MSRVTLGVCLVLGWLFLWGDVGVGPVLGGSLVAVAMFVVFPSNRVIRPHVVVHPMAVAALIAYFVRDLVVSNFLLSRELLRIRTRLRGRVIEVPMHTTELSLLTTVTNLAALTPGTMVVDADETVPSITVHILTFDGSGDPTHAVDSLYQLERRSVQAFGTDEAVAEYRRRLADADAGGVGAAAVGRTRS